MSITIIESGIYGFVGKESGLIIALRENGNEGLFASRENSPLRWIKVEEFTPDGNRLIEPEEAVHNNNDEEEFD